LPSAHFDDKETVEMDTTAQALAALADPVRLRALRVLLRHELAAGEVARVLGIAPSTTSKQIGHLREAGFVAERKDGRHVHVSVPAAVRADPRWTGLLDRVAREEDGAGDLARLRDVLREREEETEGRQGRSRRFVPGRSWAAWARALTFLVPRGMRVADLGCGDGALTLEIARFAGSVVGIDRREDVVAAARTLAAERGVANATFETADLAETPRPAKGYDLAVFSHSLQQVDDPARALRRAHEILAPRGRVLVLDLLPHREAWVVEHLGHRHLGFAPEALRGWLADAGFAEIVVERVERIGRGAGGAADPFRIVLASGIRSGIRAGPAVRTRKERSR